MHKKTVQYSDHGVSKFKYEYRDDADRSEICQLTQRHSIPLSIFAIHRIIAGANACGFQSRLKEAMDALQTFHSAENGVE
ncbi:hypothetical protein TNCV_950441 [Trichonephila clavipes]|nr:hypothetical protein TNCV_950441 [Trichonephila clavipes]